MNSEDREAYRNAYRLVMDLGANRDVAFFEAGLAHARKQQEAPEGSWESDPIWRAYSQLRLIATTVLPKGSARDETIAIADALKACEAKQQPAPIDEERERELFLAHWDCEILKGIPHDTTPTPKESAWIAWLASARRRESVCKDETARTTPPSASSSTAACPT